MKIVVVNLITLLSSQETVLGVLNISETMGNKADKVCLK